MLKGLIDRAFPEPLKEYLLKSLRYFRPSASIQEFEFQGLDVREDIRRKYKFDGDLVDIFTNIPAPLIHKWHHYLPIYDRYFSLYRDTPVRFLEIGVSRGGSLEMWRQYLGDEAVIFGIDIDEECRRFNGVNGEVRIGSQDSEAFLSSVVSEMGGVDIVLDDGSHQMKHVRKSLEVLFPKLSVGGAYMIEDLHCAYWPAYGGGLRSKGNFFSDIRDIVDGMHAWYHPRLSSRPNVTAGCSAIHVHDSVVVLEKTEMFPPTHSRLG